MLAVPLRLRQAARVTEAIVLSLLAGLLVWLIGQAVMAVPLLAAALLGLLAGGAAVVPTLGVIIRSRNRRMALALVCAGVGTMAVRVLDYARFIHLQRRAQLASDYRLSEAEADRRLDDDLLRATGRSGPTGYLLATLAEGVPLLGPYRLRGASVLALWLADLLIAAAVAARWAGGPRPAPIAT